MQSFMLTRQFLSVPGLSKKIPKQLSQVKKHRQKGWAIISQSEEITQWESGVLPTLLDALLELSSHFRDCLGRTLDSDWEALKRRTEKPASWLVLEQETNTLQPGKWRQSSKNFHLRTRGHGNSAVPPQTSGAGKGIVLSLAHTKRLQIQLQISTF